ncbi:outer membrane protein [Pseudoruegeria sp. HB172150]|uniref:outer membrane protein n=1 Tax=Pseudoruegeria sp. HB172150 TaxID=2721164 RepID=UPI0015554F63|nr:outer membrane beta-barrel protein [Pseudoruegeria sp. HB172150]
MSGKYIVRSLVAGAFACLFLAAPATAETELSFYTGYQTAPHSRVEGNDPTGVGSFSFLSEWEGRSFEMPPYWGVRATWWTPRNPNLGFGLDFSHNKVYASDETLADNGFNTLEFSDGINTVTANVWYRWPGQWANGRLTPYVGAGAGLSIPHVEVDTGGVETFNYQMTGVAVQAVAGLKYNINDRWGLFGEYKGVYSMNKADLDGGGTLETDLMTNALNVGVSFSF